MNEKKLFSKETFVELIGLTEFERIEREDYLFIEAKKLGLEKKFKESLRKYEKIFNQKISLEDNNLPSCKYDIKSINTGEYNCNINGITDKSNNKFSHIPVFPVERYVNQDTGKEKVKIIFYKENKWYEKIVDKSELAINNKLLLLSDFGLDVNSNNVKLYIQYFSDIMSLNDIPKLSSVSHIGWKDNLFIPYDNRGIFDGADEFKNIYKAIGTKGNYDKWRECINELRKNKYIKIIMATTLASPLLEKLNVLPYIVNVWSSMSGSGKTLSCMVAMSIWGNPDVGALRLSSNNTQNYYMTVASFMRNYTCYFDELQIIKNQKTLDFDRLIMDLCNGTEKGRLNKNSQANEVKTWAGNFLFTNNDKMVGENSGEQVHNRVVDLEVDKKIIENGQIVAKIVKENYGFAGKEYISYIQKIGFDEIFRRFKEIDDEIVNTTNSTDKQSSVLATIILADQLANECIFNDEYVLQIDDIKDYINDRDEIKTSIKAKNYIIDIINANDKKFDRTSFTENWGIIIAGVCTINAQILYRELKKGGFEFDTVKKEWAEMGFLVKNSVGRYIHNTTTRGEKGNFIKLNMP